MAKSCTGLGNISTPFHAVELICTADIVSPDEVLARIHYLVLTLLTNLSTDIPNVPDLSLLSRSSKNCLLNASVYGGDETIFLSHCAFSRSFLKKQFTKSYLRVWFVLKACYLLLQEGKQASQRELFYRLLSEPSTYFQCQRQVNNSIQDVVALLKCSRDSLGILASSKGSVVGHLLIQETNGDLIDCMKMGPTGQVISGDLKCLKSWRLQSDARYILLVEKDAIFQRLHEDKFFCSVPCIVITAKGYPDLASRVFLHKLRSTFPYLPILTLVDWNPAGLAIICTYKFGSIRMGLEASNYVCDVKWLGLRSGDLHHVPKESLLPLTMKDKQLGASLLCSKVFKSNATEYKEELITMLEFGHRVEIEALYAKGYSFLGRYVADKIVTRDYI